MIKHQDLLKEKEQSRLYLIHHMHHYLDGNKVIHELHHCYLFSKQNMKGEKFSVNHLLQEDKLYHVLDRTAPSILYDHINNTFQVQQKEINHKKYFII